MQSHSAISHSAMTMVVAVGTGLTACAIVLLIVLLVLIQRKRKELLATNDRLPQWNKNKSSSLGPQSSIRNWRKDSSPFFRRFKLGEIRKATSEFSTVIGQGGFGTVYKAKFDDDLVAAVKRMNKSTNQGENEFGREMELLGRLHHRHLVTLRGFCAEKVERFLVYEYMENGSLKDHLHIKTKAPLSWQTRMRIATGVAAGLEYLHSYCEPALCHRDIKSSNILLDENFVPKVADFGLAHAAPSGASNFEPITTDVRGTPGYMDPEYVITQELTEKSDVYSYGVLLLEIVTGRRAVHEMKNLVEWAQPYLSVDSKVSQIVDPDLENVYDSEELRSLIALIKLCTLSEGKHRPTMRQVLTVLYDTIDVDGTNSELCVVSNVDGGSVQSLRSSPTSHLTGSIQNNESPPLSPRSDRSKVL